MIVIISLIGPRCSLRIVRINRSTSSVNADKKRYGILRPPRGVSEAHLRQAYKPCSLEQFHHNPMRMYHTHRVVMTLLEWHNIYNLGWDEPHRPSLVAFRTKLLKHHTPATRREQVTQWRHGINPAWAPAEAPHPCHPRTTSLPPPEQVTQWRHGIMPTCWSTTPLPPPRQNRCVMKTRAQ